MPTTDLTKEQYLEIEKSLPTQQLKYQAVSLEMGKSPKRTFHQTGHADDGETREELIGITRPSGHANENHSEGSLRPLQNGRSEHRSQLVTEATV